MQPGAIPARALGYVGVFKIKFIIIYLSCCHYTIPRFLCAGNRVVQRIGFLNLAVVAGPGSADDIDYMMINRECVSVFLWEECIEQKQGGQLDLGPGYIGL